MFLRECQDVIANNILASVMLVVTARLGVVNDIARKQDASAAFVIVQTPATIAERRDVVDERVVNRRAGRDSQRIDTAQIAQDTLPEVMEVVEIDVVADREALAVPPGPANRNTR